MQYNVTLNRPLRPVKGKQGAGETRDGLGKGGAAGRVSTRRPGGEGEERGSGPLAGRHSVEWGNKGH